MDASTIINELKAQSDVTLVEKRQKKFGISSKNALGLTQKQLNDIIKGTPKNKTLALELFQTDIYEAKLLCAKLFPPKELNEVLAEEFVYELNNWEICDTFSMKLFAHAPIVDALINKWANRVAEFEKRAAFATIAGLALADKKSSNEKFLPYFNLIEKAADDERLYVKKAVSWALRSLGKRNVDIQQTAIEFAENLQSNNSKSAQWIAKDCLKELLNPNCKIADYPRALYRP